MSFTKSGIKDWVIGSHYKWNEAQPLPLYRRLAALTPHRVACWGADGRCRFWWRHPFHVARANAFANTIAVQPLCSAGRAVRCELPRQLARGEQLGGWAVSPNLLPSFLSARDRAGRREAVTGILRLLRFCPERLAADIATGLQSGGRVQCEGKPSVALGPAVRLSARGTEKRHSDEREVGVRGEIHDQAGGNLMVGAWTPDDQH
jgi:hypothetical protein